MYFTVLDILLQCLDMNWELHRPMLQKSDTLSGEHGFFFFFLMCPQVFIWIRTFALVFVCPSVIVYGLFLTTCEQTLHKFSVDHGMLLDLKTKLMMVNDIQTL